MKKAKQKRHKSKAYTRDNGPLSDNQRQETQELAYSNRPSGKLINRQSLL